MTSSNVDFPDPFGPTTATFCPSFRLKSIHRIDTAPRRAFSSSAALPPRRFFILRGVLRRHTPNGSRPLRKRSRLFPRGRASPVPVHVLLVFFFVSTVRSCFYPIIIRDNAMCASDCVCLHTHNNNNNNPEEGEEEEETLDGRIGKVVRDTAVDGASIGKTRYRYPRGRTTRGGNHAVREQRRRPRSPDDVHGRKTKRENSTHRRNL